MTTVLDYFIAPSSKPKPTGRHLPFSFTIPPLKALGSHFFLSLQICLFSTSFLFMVNTVPWYGHTAFYLPIHQLIDGWVVSTFWL